MKHDFKVGDRIIHRKGPISENHPGTGVITHVDPGGDSVQVLWDGYEETDFQWSYKLCHE